MKMSLGNYIKKAATEFNAVWKIHKFTKRIKPVCTGSVLGTSKCKDIQFLCPQLNLPFFIKNKTEKFCYTFPEINNTVKKNITEPEKSVKIIFELPITNSNYTKLDLPFPFKKEIEDPREVIDKSAASHIIRIRRKKMRTHKRRKFRKKHRAEILKKKVRSAIAKEAVFEKSVKEVLKEIETFSADKYVNQMLKDAHWEKPITRVRGFLAPKWVIEEHIKYKKAQQNLEERIEECQKLIQK